MDWVEFTGDTVAEAQDRALDALGVGRDEAEFEVVEEPSTRLLGLVKREARVRARVRPTAVRPKQDRRGRRKRGNEPRSTGGRDDRSGEASSNGGTERAGGPAKEAPAERSGARRPSGDGGQRSGRSSNRKGQRTDRDGEAQRRNAPTARDSNGRRGDGSQNKEQAMSDESAPQVSPEEVRDAAVTFMNGLIGAFGMAAETTSEIDGTEIDVVASGTDLGLLVGPGGRTLASVQDLARVASQRRLGDHDTRLRIDVGGYREKRRVALEQFTRTVAEQVIDDGTPKALEPMSSADRKVVHDAVNEIDGVESRSEGDDPRRRVVIEPA